MVRTERLIDIQTDIQTEGERFRDRDRESERGRKMQEESQRYKK